MAKRLFDELKRRRVGRVAAVYLATAFVLLQVADILVPALYLPGWTTTLIFVLLALGFVLAVILSWVVDLTPDGIVITPPRGAPQRRGRAVVLGRPAVLAGSTLLLGVLVLAAAAAFSTAPESIAAPATTSVAVLPFADLSEDRSQEYLGDGIAEELLNTLRSADVAVASRTSSFAYRNRGLSARQIAAELGVDHIIDGSVRKAGSRLRINAQLIDVRTDRQLWGEAFDRTTDDVFAIQAEIASAVTRALLGRGTAPIRPVLGTTDASAYDLYLLGLYHWNRRTPAGLHRALEVFTAATERDPAFARAWAGLAFTYFVIPEYAPYDRQRAAALCREAAERAVQLDPGSAEARTARGAALSFGGDVERALREYERAIGLDPTFATPHHWRAILLAGEGRLEEAEQSIRRARQLDPGSLAIHSFLAELLEMRARPQESLVEVDALLSRQPGYRNGLINAFIAAAQLGRAREYEHRLRDYLAAIGEDPASAALIVNALEDARTRPRAIAAVDEIVARRADAGDRFFLVGLFALLNAREQTLEMLEADPEWNLLVHRRVFDFVRGEPRFQALAARRRQPLVEVP